MKSGGGFEITGYDSFCAIMNRLSADSDYLKECGDKASAFVRDKSGATERVIANIKL